MKKYVTYGFGTIFNQNMLITDLHDGGNDKPRKAWWGSPINADYGQKEWCLDNYYLIYEDKNLSFEENAANYFADDNKIIWTLDSKAKILFVNDLEDLYDYLELGYIVSKEEQYGYPRFKWDFYKVLKDGYSAIELTNAYLGHGFRSPIEDLMNCWDCESIVVLDQDVIVPFIFAKQEK